jgi:pimeloyl-ACP methyl ester carboxylesterase
VARLALSIGLAALPEQESEEKRSDCLLERNIDLAAASKFLWPIPDRSLERRIHRVKAPVLLLWGEEDRIAPPVYAQEFSSRLENVKTVMLARCGHLAMLEEPERFDLEVGEFFR